MTQTAGEPSSSNNDGLTPVFQNELPTVTNEYTNNVLFYFAWEFIAIKSLLLGERSEERPWTLSGWGPSVRSYALLRGLIVIVVFWIGPMIWMIWRWLWHR